MRCTVCDSTYEEDKIAELGLSEPLTGFVYWNKDCLCNRCFNSIGEAVSDYNIDDELLEKVAEND